MKYYAAENTISTAPITGGIEITEQQYQDAMVAMQSGQSIAVRGEGLRILSVETIRIYDDKGHEKYIASNDDIPNGWTTEPPEPSTLPPLSDAELIAGIKLEAGRRISESGLSWMVERQVSGGAPIPQEIIDYAAAVRAASEALEANPPQDYQNNQYWPTPLIGD